jgi:type VI secretion system secreted protein Hcp
MKKLFQCLLLLLCAVTVARGSDMFLFLEGIQGESLDSRHKDWIDILSFSKVISRSGTTGTNATFSDLLLHKNQDKSSPLLALRAANGARIPRAVLELIQPGETRARFYQVTLSNSTVRTWQISGSAGQDQPVEGIGLDYEWISWAYTEFDASGRPRPDLSAYWDLMRNRGGVGADAPFILSGTKQGTDIVITWPGRANTTYNVTGSPVLTGPYSVVRSITQTSNGPVRLTFPISSGNLFYRAETPP